MAARETSGREGKGTNSGAASSQKNKLLMKDATKTSNERCERAEGKSSLWT